MQTRWARVESLNEVKVREFTDLMVVRRDYSRWMTPKSDNPLTWLSMGVVSSW